MADDDLDITGEDIESTPEKKKNRVGLLTGLLKWIIVAVGVVIAVVTIVVVTVKNVSSSSPEVSAIPISEEYIGKREVLSWYRNIDQIRTKTADTNPRNVLVEVVLGYKLDNREVSAEITQRIIEIRDFLRRYFSQKKASELKPLLEEQLRAEIKRAINDDILGETAIKDVRFLVLEVSEL